MPEYDVEYTRWERHQGSCGVSAKNAKEAAWKVRRHIDCWDDEATVTDRSNPAQPTSVTRRTDAQTD